MFSNTRSGAEISSIWYSIVESAKENELDVQAYLAYILEKIKDNEDIDYHDLLPCSDKSPDRLIIKNQHLDIFDNIRII